MSDPRQLGPLLAGEIARRIPTLEKVDADVMDVRAALHAIRGSAAMAGEHDLALVVGQIGARVRAGDATAREDAADLFKQVLGRLKKDASAFGQKWPEPPPLLGASLIDARYRAEYTTEMRARLEELDAVLATQEPSTKDVDETYRAVHSMKGAAMALGDDALVWYLHGLETTIKKGQQSDGEPGDVLFDLSRHRTVLAGLIEDPERTLESLRAPEQVGRPARPAEPERPTASRRTSIPPPPDADLDATEAQLRVPGDAVDRLLERLDAIDLVQDELRAGGDTAQRTSETLRSTRTELIEALNLIGPSTPWGAPVAALDRIRRAARQLSTASQTANEAAYFVRHSADRIHANTQQTRHEIATLRRTSVRWIFDRVKTAVEGLAAREGKLVDVVVEGADVPLDRRVAERILDSVLQLARNAVAHAIDRPEARVRAGMPARGTIQLEAERLGDWLRIVIEDDGSGVDVEKIRTLAVRHDVLTQHEASLVHDDEVLALLFVAGLTTRDEADLVAGRGVGLDLAQAVVRRLGGTIRLAKRATGGLRATLDVPSEAGMAEILWVEASGVELAVPVGFTGKVVHATDATKSVPLADCIGLGTPSPAPALSIELDIRGVEPISIGIDKVGTIEDAVIRALPPIVASAGPYSGAILKGNGSLKLLVDAARLAARAWARAG